MKVGFFYQNNGQVSKGILSFAKHMLQSIRTSMPGVEVWQLSDGQSPELPGIDGVKRLSTPLPMAVRRVSLHATCEGEWLFIDTDVIVRKDVREVFSEDFDVALTDREGTITYESGYAKVMPYNIGVVFSRSPKFWETVKKYLLMMPVYLQHWEGDQRVVAGMMAHPGKCGFNVKVISGAEYNYPPKSENDPQIERASIVHYKGARKKYLEVA